MNSSVPKVLHFTYSQVFCPKKRRISVFICLIVNHLHCLQMYIYMSISLQSPKTQSEVIRLKLSQLVDLYEAIILLFVWYSGDWYTFLQEIKRTFQNPVFSCLSHIILQSGFAPFFFWKDKRLRPFFPHYKNFV